MSFAPPGSSPTTPRAKPGSPRTKKIVDKTEYYSKGKKFMGDKSHLPTHLFYGCVGKMRPTASENDKIEAGKKLSAHRNTAKEIARSNDALNKSNQEITKARKKKLAAEEDAYQAKNFSHSHKGHKKGIWKLNNTKLSKQRPQVIVDVDASASPAKPLPPAHEWAGMPDKKPWQGPRQSIMPANTAGKSLNKLPAVQSPSMRNSVKQKIRSLQQQLADVESTNDKRSLLQKRHERDRIFHGLRELLEVLDKVE